MLDCSNFFNNVQTLNVSFELVLLTSLILLEIKFARLSHCVKLIFPCVKFCLFSSLFFLLCLSLLVLGSRHTKGILVHRFSKISISKAFLRCNRKTFAQIQDSKERVRSIRFFFWKKPSSTVIILLMQ